MSVVRLDGSKAELPRLGADGFWSRLHEHYSSDDLIKWKYLAMLALRESCGWTLEQIGMSFGHPKGHVVRCLQSIKQEIRGKFAVYWDEGFSNPDQPS